MEGKEVCGCATLTDADDRKLAEVKSMVHLEFMALGYEITKGMDQVKLLKTSSSGDEEMHLERMLASYEEARMILKDIAREEQGQSVASL